MQLNGLACVNTVAAVVQEKQGTIACGEGKMVADRAAFFTRKENVKIHYDHIAWHVDLHVHPLIYL